MRGLKISLIVSLIAPFAALASFGGGVKMAQTFTLTNGWNGVYVRVGPEEDCDTLFANWPVASVSLYRPSALENTRQFVQSGDSEGIASAAYAVWRRDDPSASTLRYVPANSILVTFVTNTVPWCAAATFYGAPAAPRITWHDSSAQGTQNIVGFSVAPGEDTLTDTYFSGLDVGAGVFYVFGGTNPAQPYIVLPTTRAGARHFRDGETLLVDTKKTSDWSGVLNVSPMNGIDFGTDETTARLEIRNDSATPRSVTLQLRPCDAQPLKGLPPELPPSVHWRDADATSADHVWQSLTGIITLEDETTCVTNYVATKELAVGETWKVDVAVDRTQFDANSKSGTVYGAIAEICDATPAALNAYNVITGGSHMVAYVPVSVTDDGRHDDSVWQHGLWIVSASLDTVTHVGEAETYGGSQTHDVPAGGKMKVRLLLYVDEEGAMTLLQRITYGHDTNGTVRVYSGAYTASDTPLTDVKRLSTPFLPTDMPEIAFSTTNNLFGGFASVSFTVSEDSNVNPMRHARHPSHDGLDAYFEKKTPSGDNWENYMNTVKPEAFSVANTIAFTWDSHSGTVWAPLETLTGTLKWQFGGLRHPDGDQTTLLAQGPFTSKRIYKGRVKVKSGQ